VAIASNTFSPFTAILLITKFELLAALVLFMNHFTLACVEPLAGTVNVTVFVPALSVIALFTYVVPAAQSLTSHESDETFVPDK
jgi:fatty acid desaturase